MRKLIILCFALSACDAYQHGEGVVMNAETRKPLDGVAYGKGERDDGNTFHRREYTGADGHYDFSSTGFTNSFELYFTKPGYQTVVARFAERGHDTVWMKPTP